MGYYSKVYDVKNCDQEPVHIIRAIQPYGGLFVFQHSQPDLLASSDFEDESVARFAYEINKDFLLGYTETERILGDKRFLLTVTNESQLIEVEPIYSTDGDLSPLSLKDTLLKISKPDGSESLIKVIAEEIKAKLPYDHVMVYKFDEDYNGTVIAEEREEDRPSYLDLRFPATDIPVQVRQLYLRNKIRIIYNASEQQSMLKFKEFAPDVDLSDTSIRGVSPIHLEYLTNMGVLSSCSIAIVHGGKLWGLIACHGTKPVFLSKPVRDWLIFLSEMIENILAKELEIERQALDQKFELYQVQLQQQLLMNSDLTKALNTTMTLRLMDADGMIVIKNGEIYSEGLVPEEEIIVAMLTSLSKSDEDIYLASHFSDWKIGEVSEANEIKGFLAIRLARRTNDYIIWFRQGMVESVKWAGDPHNVKYYDENLGRLRPRLSFEAWEQNHSEKSHPWTKIQIDFANRLRNEIRDLVYRKFNELEMLNNELRQSYADMEHLSYTIGHDLMAPIRIIKGYTEILKEDYEQLFDEKGLQLMDVIESNINHMSQLISSILQYGKTNKVEFKADYVSIHEIALQIWEPLTSSNHLTSKLRFDEDMPKVVGDRNLLRQLLENLLSNSIKYRKQDVDLDVLLGYEPLNDQFCRFYIKDNGVGIPENQISKVFQMFVRGLNIGQVEGSGIGLSIVKKIVERHNGEVNLKSDEHGTTVLFSLPTSSEYQKLKKNTKN